MFLVLICTSPAGMIFGIRPIVCAGGEPDSGDPARAEAGAPGDGVYFRAKFEAYFNDQFGFRKRLIYWLAVVKVQGLGVTSTPGVTLGRDGWLYLASDAAVSSYRATRPFTPEKLERYRLILEARRDWLADAGFLTF